MYLELYYMYSGRIWPREWRQDEERDEPHYTEGLSVYLRINDGKWENPQVIDFILIFVVLDHLACSTIIYSTLRAQKELC